MPVAVEQIAPNRVWIFVGQQRRGPYDIGGARRQIAIMLHRWRDYLSAWRQNIQNLREIIEQWAVGAVDGDVAAARAESVIASWGRRSAATQEVAALAAQVPALMRRQHNAAPSEALVRQCRFVVDTVERQLEQHVADEMASCKDALAVLDALEAVTPLVTRGPAYGDEAEQLAKRGYVFERVRPGVWDVTNPSKVTYRTVLQPPSCSCPWGRQVAEWGLDLSRHPCKHYKAVRELESRLTGERR